MDLEYYTLTDKIAELHDCIEWDESKDIDNGYGGKDYHSSNEMVSSRSW